MELLRKCSLKFDDLSLDERKDLLNAMFECFPNDKEDRSYINGGLKEDSIDLYYDSDKKLVGFLTYENDMLESFISRIGVVGKRNQGVATKILKNHLKENKKQKIYLTCLESNNARYLYHKLGFLVEDKAETKDKTYLDFIHFPNEELNNTARVLNETYKLSKLVKNRNLELTIKKMYENKFYDNLYQYDLNNNQIDKVIAESALFAQCLSLLDYAKPKYHAFYNYNVKNQPDLVFFYFIKYKVLDEFVKEKLNQPESEQKETIRKLDEVLDRMIAEDVDEILVEGLKDPEIEKE